MERLAHTFAVRFLVIFKGIVDQQEVRPAASYWAAPPDGVVGATRSSTKPLYAVGIFGQSTFRKDCLMCRG